MWLVVKASKNGHIVSEIGIVDLCSKRLMNLIKAHPLKDSVAGKIQRACWGGSFKVDILFGQQLNKA